MFTDSLRGNKAFREHYKNVLIPLFHNWNFKYGPRIETSSEDSLYIQLWKYSIEMFHFKFLSQNDIVNL